MICYFRDFLYTKHCFAISLMCRMCQFCEIFNFWTFSGNPKFQCFYIRNSFVTYNVSLNAIKRGQRRSEYSLFN